jgi:thioredoxin
MPDSWQAFRDRLAQNGRPVVVDFWAPWCGPCRAIEPSMKRLEEAYSGRVDVWRINADEQPDLLRQLKVYGIPTLVTFQNEQEIARQTGAQPQASLARLFEAALSGEPPVKAGLSWTDRLVRLVAGTILLLMAYFENFAGFYLAIALVGGGVLFSAVYDRCPIWKALSARFGELIQRKSGSQTN